MATLHMFIMIIIKIILPLIINSRVFIFQLIPCNKHFDYFLIPDYFISELILVNKLVLSFKIVC